MKTKFLTVAVLMASGLVMAQKKELKEAEKLIATGKFAEAKTIVSALDASSIEAKLKPQYDFVMAQALSGKVAGAKFEDLETAVKAYKALSEGSSKYKIQAKTAITTMSNNVVNDAVEDQNKKSFKEAAKKLHLAYTMREQDTSYLYFAAANSVNGKDYDTALKYYEQLSELNYDGSEKQYVGVDVTTGEEKVYSDKAQRDLLVKGKQLNSPSERTSPSRSGEVARMLALIYVEQGKDEEAFKAIDKAKAANPDDTSLLQTEANLYYKSGNVEKYKEIMETIVTNDPKNPDLYFNLGVSASQLGDNAKAISYYKKAIELKPNYVTAKLNLSSTMLADDQKLVEEMNALGNSAADNKRFDEIKDQRFKAYREAVPFLESALKDEPNNIAVVQTLSQIYAQLDDPKYDEMKAKLKSLEAAE